jgi:L-ascorbate metabolism protein UlaG (beta-lactamase superfamily)
MRNPFAGPNTALWGGYLLRSPVGRTIYLSGDTGYFDGFADIGREADIDLAIVNLGAYAPRWFMARSHMDPARAVRAFKELGARRLMAVHWGAFRLGDEPVYLPPVELAREMAGASLSDRLVPLEPGQTLFLD